MYDQIAVEVKILHKYFGEVKAVQEIDFAVCAGEIFSLLGPIGAGKTTTIDYCHDPGVR
jgi:ABC-2 type transport system ATP-binding protein